MTRSIHSRYGFDTHTLVDRVSWYPLRIDTSRALRARNERAASYAPAGGSWITGTRARSGALGVSVREGVFAWSRGVKVSVHAIFTRAVRIQPLYDAHAPHPPAADVHGIPRDRPMAPRALRLQSNVVVRASASSARASSAPSRMNTREPTVRTNTRPPSGRAMPAAG
jgi:hypothetical protein